MEQRFFSRKIIRAEFHDYSGGLYFVTICTREREHYFGEIVDSKMVLSSVGKQAYFELENLTNHYPYIEVPLFVVMPNHIHIVIAINNNSKTERMIPRIRTVLGVVVGGFKQAVTRFARKNGIEFGWQPRFHDHIIRNQRESNLIHEYIMNNVARWDADCYYSER